MYNAIFKRTLSCHSEMDYFDTKRKTLILKCTTKAYKYHKDECIYAYKYTVWRFSINVFVNATSDALLQIISDVEESI